MQSILGLGATVGLRADRTPLQICEMGTASGLDNAGQTSGNGVISAYFSGQSSFYVFHFLPMRTPFLAVAFLFISLFGALAGPDPEPAVLAEQAQQEFMIWIASESIQKIIQEKHLSGHYIFTVVLDAKGKVQTVYADENPDENIVARQNDMARLIRIFRSRIRLKKHGQVKFKPEFSV